MWVPRSKAERRAGTAPNRDEWSLDRCRYMHNSGVAADSERGVLENVSGFKERKLIAEVEDVRVGVREGRGEVG